MGTTNSWIYISNNAGETWTRLAHLGNVGDLVIDSLLVDKANPKTLYAGVWQMGGTGGGVYISHDGGHTWAASPGIEGQSVRSLAQAVTNPKILVAGAISGVFRTEDGGAHWTQISPVGSLEIRKIESLAIDPTDPNIIYAGTWHLPWKTTNGGRTWQNIRRGLIVDSDIFTILLDPKFPSTVYMSACSGIYKSETGGELFRKIQGIPTTARRTRALVMDPHNRSVIYAGTTEGLYKTVDAGAVWTRMTSPNVIINDIYVDPANPNRVLLATDRGGVLLSNNGGVSFVASNRGFSQRQVMALLTDAQHPQTMYAGVVNDKTFGGVFVTEDGGLSWTQRSAGLDGRDVFSLAQAADGTVFAGTNNGIFRLNGYLWTPDNRVVNTGRRTVYVWRHHRRDARTINDGSESLLTGQVNSLSLRGPVWFAATDNGVYRSTNQGATWSGPDPGSQPYRFVVSHDGMTVAASIYGLRVSQDGGQHWHTLLKPDTLTVIDALTITPNGTLWVGGPQGAFYSRDLGQTWNAMSNLPVRGIDNINYDAGLGRVIITSRDSDVVFALNPDNKTWEWWNPGWKLRMVHSLDGRLVGASLYDGVVVQPKSAYAQSTERAQR